MEEKRQKIIKRWMKQTNTQMQVNQVTASQDLPYKECPLFAKEGVENDGLPNLQATIERLVPVIYTNEFKNQFKIQEEKEENALISKLE